MNIRIKMLLMTVLIGSCLGSAMAGETGGEQVTPVVTVTIKNEAAWPVYYAEVEPLSVLCGGLIGPEQRVVSRCGQFVTNIRFEQWIGAGEEKVVRINRGKTLAFYRCDTRAAISNVRELVKTTVSLVAAVATFCKLPWFGAAALAQAASQNQSYLPGDRVHEVLKDGDKLIIGNQGNGIKVSLME